MRHLLLAAAAAALVAPPAIAQPMPTIEIQTKGPVISVSATGIVRSAPDLAVLDAGVTTVAPTAQAALTENARKMDGVIKQLRSMGVAANDIQTSGINVHPQYNYPGRQTSGLENVPRIVGYNASNRVQVRYRDLDRLGALLDALVKAGANQINGPFFQIEEGDAAVRAARDKALAEAEAQARYYAAKMGGGTPRLLSITEGHRQQMYAQDIMVTGMAVQEARAAPPPPPTPVAPGEVTTSVIVTAQYALER